MDNEAFYDDTLANQPWNEKCTCGKTFTRPNGYATHIRACSKFKARLQKRLNAKRQERAQNHQGNGPDGIEHETSEKGRKRRRPNWLNGEALEVDILQPVDLRAPESELVILVRTAETFLLLGSQLTFEIKDPTISLQPDQGISGFGPVEVRSNILYRLTFVDENASQNVVLQSPEQLGRGHRHKIPSLKVRESEDVLPSPALPLSWPAPPHNNDHISADQQAECVSIAIPEQRIETRANIFGLYKVYKCSPHDIPHDPDSSTSLSDLRDTETLAFEHQQEPESHRFHPFPNASSFALGEWFWSDDHERSQKSFKALLKIVGSEEFKPGDVRQSNWTAIDRALAANDNELDELGPGWDDDGIAWTTQSITIRVPFNTTSKIPGTQTFTVPNFHYRPLVPIIKQKLENSRDQEFFHILGHELRWCPGAGKEDVRVHGEMYNSPAFIEAQEALHVHLLRSYSQHRLISAP